MVSKKYAGLLAGVLIGLTVIVGGGLVVTKDHGAANTTQATHQTVVTYHGIRGVNALTVLKLYHRVQTKTYSGFGEEVIGIDGVAANSKHYWAFYINGKLAQVGAGSYVTKASDTLTWKLEAL